MAATNPSPRPLATLREFYVRMAATREARAALVKDVLAGRKPAPEAVDLLAATLRDLSAAPLASGEPESDAGRRVLKLDSGAPMHLSLEYEITELKKDLLYLDKGEDALCRHLAEVHPRFDEQVEQSVAALAGIDFRCFVSDRDGTVNNYCGRYRSSIQSAYNAVFLTHFARARARFPILLTSAPLADIGIVDISCAPEKTFIYAGSKGREFQDLDGAMRRKEIDAARQARLDELNRRLKALIEEPGLGVYGLIGSGLQFKFGQTTVARQDVSGTVSAADSEAFLGRVRDLVAGLDPKGDFFRIEDTGLDIEVILTVGDSTGGLKDFDKGDGVRFLDQALAMNMARGPHLVCGDTGSDVPMLQAAMEAIRNAAGGVADQVRAVFVTGKAELAERVRGLCPGAVIVDQPDVLVTVLRKLAKA